MISDKRTSRLMSVDFQCSSANNRLLPDIFQDSINQGTHCIIAGFSRNFLYAIWLRSTTIRLYLQPAL